MILLDTDHLSVLTDPRQALRVPLLDRLQASEDNVAIPAPAVEEQLRAWLAQIHRVTDVGRQIAPYQRLVKLIDFLGDWTIVEWDEPAAATFRRRRAARIRQDIVRREAGTNTGSNQLALPSDFTTVSIAFWVKPEFLRNRWNAILFCDDWSEHDLHLSLLQNGAANVAIHRGSASGAHFASFAEVGNSEWHHVAVVCDTRAGGSIQFYIDGRPDRRHCVFGPEATVHLTGVRLGGYNVWKNNPAPTSSGPSTTSASIAKC